LNAGHFRKEDDMKQEMKHSVFIAAFLALALAGCQKQEAAAPAPEMPAPEAPAPQAAPEPAPMTETPASEAAPPESMPAEPAPGTPPAQ
jgi:PBP1b-binding outer membrane lipoprotein LpoB